MNPKHISQNRGKSPPFWTSFWRSQATSIMSSAADFMFYALLFYLFAINPIFSSACGNILGAVISFYLGRHWAFENTEGKLTSQVPRYILTSLCSASINSYGIYLILQAVKTEPTIAKIVMAILVGIFFNFPMFKYFVYREMKTMDR